jgi:hypothetical protein
MAGALDALKTGAAVVNPYVAAAMTALVFTRRWPLLALAALIAVGGSVVFAVYLEQID